MIIRRITLNNYRQYAGKVVFNLSQDEINNITVIQGTTGAGKSCLYGAIHWSLYNNDLVANTNDPANVEGILNTPIFKSLEIGEKEKVRVKIKFGNSKVTTLTVERSADIKKLMKISIAE